MEVSRGPGNRARRAGGRWRRGGLRAVVIAAACVVAGPAAAQELADPMRPPDAGAPAETAAGPPPEPRPALRLQSTLVANGRRSAVISGRSVREGGRIEGVRVVAIGPSTVRLRDGRGAFTLRLPSLGIKRNSE